MKERVGLVQVDGKWPNLALMKLSTYHKRQGDTVEWFSPLFHYAVVYASKVFSFSDNYFYLPFGAVRGGTGYDLHSKLPPEVEECQPDYTLYPDAEFALGFTTRGCVRRCPFCVVPQKEGLLRVVADDIRVFWTGQPELRLLDNNLTAAPMEHFRSVIGQVASHGIALDITQGLDLRLLTEEHARLLARVKWRKQVRAAWDNPADEQAIRRGLEVLLRHIPAYRVMVYVLIGYDTTEEEDLHRVEFLRSYGVDPFVMPYERRDAYQRAFARWVNRKPIFKTVEWRDYRGTTGMVRRSP